MQCSAVLVKRTDTLDNVYLVLDKSHDANSGKYVLSGNTLFGNSIRVGFSFTIVRLTQVTHKQVDISPRESVV